MNARDLLLQVLKRNPSIQNNPLAQDYISVIQSNDSVRGEQIANNLLQAHGLSKDEGLAQAKTFFHLT